jgi:hypothetical protein
MIILLQIIAAIAGCLLALLSIPLFLRLHWPAPVLWAIKLYSSALSAWFAGAALLVTIAGLATGSLFITLPGLNGVSVYDVERFLAVIQAQKDIKKDKASTVEKYAQQQVGITRH